jgi:beta-phosphoglucomutase
VAIQAVIFDMDGVLVEAKDWHYEALNAALALFGLDLSRDEHLAFFDGLPTRKKLEVLGVSRNLPAKLHPLINELKQKFTLDIILSRCRPVFHVQYALAALRRSGYRLAVCSNSVRLSRSLTRKCTKPPSVGSGWLRTTA